MPYFKDSSNKLHFLDDVNDAAKYLSVDCIEITDTEALVIQTPVVTLADAKSAQIILLKTAYVDAIQQSVTYTSIGKVTQSYQTDITNSVSNLQASLAGCLLTATTPTGFYWVAADNAQVPFTYADLQGLSAVIFIQGANAFANLQNKKNAVNIAIDIATVQSIIF